MKSSRINCSDFGALCDPACAMRMVLLLVRLAAFSFESAMNLTLSEAGKWLEIAQEIEAELAHR